MCNNVNKSQKKCILRESIVKLYSDYDTYLTFLCSWQRKMYFTCVNVLLMSPLPFCPTSDTRAPKNSYVKLTVERCPPQHFLLAKRFKVALALDLRRQKMKHLIFHVVVFLCFHRVTVWPNLFFWACRGRANMTEEVWSLHSNLASPTLCPHSYAALELTGAVDVTRCHRHGVR